MLGESLYAIVADIKDVRSYRNIINTQGPKIIVLSSATCTACDSHMQALNLVAKRHPNLTFYKFDVGDLPDLRKELEIKYYPTTVFLPLGKKIERSMGVAEFEEIIHEVTNGKKSLESDSPQRNLARSSKKSWRKK
jgi:thiol-disulfide isomerase/thioredoxin